jgi:hypothetical protein
VRNGQPIIAISDCKDSHPKRSILLRSATTYLVVVSFFFFYS